MATLTIRNLPDSVHDALRRRAAESRRSMEAEARTILGQTLAPKPSLDLDRLGRLQNRAIAAFGGEMKKVGEVDRFLKDRASAWGE